MGFINVTQSKGYLGPHEALINNRAVLPISVLFWKIFVQQKGIEVKKPFILRLS